MTSLTAFAPTPLDQVFIGKLTPLPPEGQMSGIFKQAVQVPVTVSASGLAGDQQGDLRHHGGPDKAVHHYPAEHYATLRAKWPAIEGLALPGVLGENISTRGLTEIDICIGDTLRAGTAVLQVSQPRQPCWKINHRLDIARAAAFVFEQGITGWYYRVLEPGMIGPGDTLELLERPSPWLTLAHYWRSVTTHRPDPAMLVAIAAAPGLAADKAARHAERARWLRENG